MGAPGLGASQAQRALLPEACPREGCVRAPVPATGCGLSLARVVGGRALGSGRRGSRPHHSPCGSGHTCLSAWRTAGGPRAWHVPGLLLAATVARKPGGSGRALSTVSTTEAGEVTGRGAGARRPPLEGGSPPSCQADEGFGASAEVFGPEPDLATTRSGPVNITFPSSSASKVSEFVPGRRRPARPEPPFRQLAPQPGGQNPQPQGRVQPTTCRCELRMVFPCLGKNQEEKNPPGRVQIPRRSHSVCMKRVSRKQGHAGSGASPWQRPRGPRSLNCHWGGPPTPAAPRNHPGTERLAARVTPQTRSLRPAGAGARRQYFKHCRRFCHGAWDPPARLEPQLCASRPARDSRPALPACPGVRPPLLPRACGQGLRLAPAGLVLGAPHSDV